MSLYRKALVMYIALGISLCTADVSSPFRRAKKAYDLHQYDKTIQLAQRALQVSSKAPKQTRMRLLFLLSMAQFQLGNPMKSLTPMRQIWTLFPSATAPSYAQRTYKEWYKRAHKQHLKAHPPRRALPRRAAPRKVLPRPSRLPVKTPKRTPARKVQTPAHRIAARKTTPLPPPRQGWFQRHKTSVILLGVAGAVLIAGTGAGIAFQGQQSQLQTLDAAADSSGLEIDSAHRRAQVSGILSMTCLIAGGTIGAAGLGVLLYELSRPTR